MESDTQSRMVMLPVPEYLVTDVYRFIVREEERRTSSAYGKDDSEEPQQAEEEWRYSRDWSMEDLRDVLENGTRAMKIILPYLAEHPDVSVKGQVLAEQVYGQGANAKQLGGALGSFTKTAIKRYGRYKWPFEAVRNHEERLWEYKMYPVTAEKVLKLTRT